MRLFVITAAAAFFPMAALMTTEAVAVQDTPATMNGVETVCTGVGSAKDNPAWSAYPVKIVLATTGGANLANAHITIAKGGQALVQTECDAPWILVKAPAGSYTATASLIGGSGASHSANFTTNGSGPQKEITITFARPSNATPPSQ